MSEARAKILARIRVALGDGPSRTELSAVGRARARPASDESHVAVDRGQIVGLFAERVADYRAIVVRTDDVAGAVAEAVQGYKIRSLVVPADLDPEWTASLEPGLLHVDGGPSLSPMDLDRVDAVLTGAAVGIAETGTIVLDHQGAGQGRRSISLVPDIHVCVVLADQVVASVPEAMPRLNPTRPLTWISGPSATSDIELNRVEGVHGPRTLHVILCD